MPTLYILAGANGAGKTTFYQAAKEAGLLDESVPFITQTSLQRLISADILNFR